MTILNLIRQALRSLTADKSPTISGRELIVSYLLSPAAIGFIRS